MKKLFTIAILGLLATGAFAQTSQGTIAVSGSLGINRSQEKTENPYDPHTTTTTGIGLRPGLGYMINDGLELGITFGLDYSKTKYVNEKESSDFTSELNFTGITFSPYVRKYFTLSEKLAFTGTASAGFSVGKYKYDNSLNSETMESGRSSVFASVVPGITYFPTEKIGLSTYFGSLGYTQTTTYPEEGQNKTVESNFGLNLSSSTFGIGFSYYINR